MKVFFTSVLTIICLAILIFGNIYWGNKTTVRSIESVVSDRASSEVEEVEQSGLSDEEISLALSLASNWPENALTHLEESLKNSQPFHILIAGSTSLGEGPTSWPEIVKQRLLDTYGEHLLTVSIEIFDMTTKEFLDEEKSKLLADSEADLILFEPFTLKDNGVVVIEDSIIHIETIMNNVQENNPNTNFILQPPHPITGSSWYPVQVRELEKFATANEIPYFNHWESWPEPANDYLTPEKDAPNEQGHEIWASYIENILIAE